MKAAALKKLVSVTRKHQQWWPYFDKLVMLPFQLFSCDTKVFRTTYLQNTSGKPLLIHVDAEPLLIQFALVRNFLKRIVNELDKVILLLGIKELPTIPPSYQQSQFRVYGPICPT